LRRDPVKVFLIGVTYSENDRAQNVDLGQVTKRELGDRFRYDIDLPVDLQGFSGAPIIDVRGQVVGVMTVWVDRKNAGEFVS
jgi:S1-C subfamily serine protease